MVEALSLEGGGLGLLVCGSFGEFPDWDLPLSRSLILRFLLGVIYLCP